MSSVAIDYNYKLPLQHRCSRCMSWEKYKQKDRLLNRQFPSGSIFFTFLLVQPKMCEISSDFGFLEGFNTSTGMGALAKSPIFMYAELVCNIL